MNQISFPAMCSRYDFLYLYYDFAVSSEPEYVEFHNYSAVNLNSLLSEFNDIFTTVFPSSELVHS